MNKIINRLIFRYFHKQWCIAIANINDNLELSNIRWMKHNYTDRWFADPFIISETHDNYVILAEEKMMEQRKARIARLLVSKKDCKLIKNETVLELNTHLSFPCYISVGGQIFVFPENGLSGKTRYYRYGKHLEYCGDLSQLPLADAVIEKIGDKYYMFFTIGRDCNGSKLNIYASDSPFGQYIPFDEIYFGDNIARRAGKIFIWHNKLISPAQICNNDYGEGISLQEVIFDKGKISLCEFKRYYPNSNQSYKGFHTFNVFKNSLALDGYTIRMPLLSKLYFKLRGCN